MRATQHPSNNDLLRPPQGATHEECVPLAITRVIYQPANLDGVRSYWQPSEAERKAIAEGALVLFSCWGRTHPPIWIGVDGLEEGA